MKAALSAVAFIALILGAYGMVDRIDRDADDRIQYRKFVADSCIPARAGERAVAYSDGKRLRCTIYSHAEYGQVPLVVSAAVMDVPL